MRYAILLSLLLAAAFCSTAAGQRVLMPDADSPERKAILNALRIPVEADLKQKVVFSVETMSMLGNWAYLDGQPRSPAGGIPNYRGTRYQKAKDAGMFDNSIFALLKKTGGKWSVVRYAIGCTDICYADWWRRYKAPKAIFPYTE